MPKIKLTKAVLSNVDKKSPFTRNDRRNIITD